MKKYCYLIFVMLLAVGCSTSKMNVINVRKAAEIKNYSLVYALPKTVLVVDIEATKKTIIPGPYSKYAKKYLGINNVSVKTKTKWEISNVAINTRSEADPNNFYFVQSSNNNIANYVNLTKDGFLAPLFSERKEVEI